MRKILLATLALGAAVPVGAALPKGWVGKDTCNTCHEDVVKAFVAGPHGRRMATVAKDICPLELKGDVLERSCESCHGPGEAHANEPTKTNIRTLHGSARDASSGCASCHAAQAAGIALRTPAHERAGVACLDCHVSGHAVPAAEPLLARDRGSLCTPCHGAEVAQFSLPYAHREGRKPFECTSCHSVHGGTTVRGRVEELGRDRCVTCHTEKAGPQVYPHPPQMVGGCTSCHRPHGSPNASLLTRSSVAQLCLECHSDTTKFHDLSRPMFQNCPSCHSAVHGSQRDPKLFNE
ncbi:MAG TPA: cytochrome c3 family protein [Thermoanaerobaculaceae bacterium]|nr:cytochrome c3 family protein [Thermoanaerobaculaceae bacterium]